MLLTALEHGHPEDLIDRGFEINVITFEGLMVGLLSAVLEHTYKVCVSISKPKWRVFKWIGSSKIFRRLDQPRYVTDVTL